MTKEKFPAPGLLFVCGCLLLGYFIGVMSGWLR